MSIDSKTPTTPRNHFQEDRQVRYLRSSSSNRVGHSDGTVVRALHNKPSGCVFQSGSYLCLWDVPYGVSPSPYMSGTANQSIYQKTTELYYRISRTTVLQAGSQTK